jgi:hypothetical protein
MSNPTFIVGTGRCRTTMLLGEHPRGPGLSEFFAIVTDAGQSKEPFAGGEIDGRQFWSIVAA